jgi:hypothetical protein
MYKIFGAGVLGAVVGGLFVETVLNLTTAVRYITSGLPSSWQAWLYVGAVAFFTIAVIRENRPRR